MGDKLADMLWGTLLILLAVLTTVGYLAILD